MRADPGILPMDWRDVPDPGMFDWGAGVAARIRSWSPSSAVCAGPDWERIGPGVRETVGRAFPVSAQMASGLLGAVTAVAVFALRRGLGAGPGVWLDPVTLRAFLVSGRDDLAFATRAQYVSRVRSLADPLPLADRDVMAPYSPREMAGLWSAAGAASTVRGRRDLRVLIALGAGCGLSGGEIAQVRAHDVTATGSAVVVQVRGPGQRLMVARRMFEQALADAAAEYVGQVVYLVRRDCYTRAGVVSKVAASMTRPEKCPSLRTRRLRASWLCEMAGSGLALPVLAAAAGITDLGRLTRLLRYLAQPEVSDAERALREN
jgi:hypothetical protein